MKKEDWTALEEKIKADLRLTLDIINCRREIAKRVKPVVEDFKKRYKRVDKRFVDEINNIDGIKCSLRNCSGYKVFIIWPTDLLGDSTIYDYICVRRSNEKFSFNIIYEEIERWCKEDMTDYFALKLDNLEKDFADMRKIYEDIESLRDRSNLFGLTSVLRKLRELMYAI